MQREGIKRRSEVLAPVVACLFSAVSVFPAEPVCKLAWDPSPDPAVTATVLYYGTNSRSYFSSNSYPAGVTNAAISNLTVGVVYYFAATAVNQYGVESEYSNEVILTNALADTTGGTPEPGGGTSGEVTGGTTNTPVCKLAWDPSPDPSVIATILYYGTNSRSYFASNSYPVGVTNAAISNLTVGVVYYFAATAVNQYGVESEYSNEVILTNALPETPTDPEAGGGTSPPSLLLSLTSGSLHYLTWDLGTDPTVTGAILYYGTNSRAYFASNSYPTGVTSAAISNLTDNAVYYLTVTAVNQSGAESEYSNEVLLTNFVAELPPLPDPDDPSGTNTPPGDTQSPTNYEAYIVGMPPALHLGVTNGMARYTILGTLGASMALETSASLDPAATWSTVTNIDFVTPAPTNAGSGGGGVEVPARLAEAFVPAVAEVEIPVVQVGSLRFSRVTMPYSYPVLADHNLQAKGYQTYLILVRLPGVDGRDVCYIAEDQAYIDYEAETGVVRLSTSGATIREIATRLADSLGMNWTSASQFLYTESGEQVVATVVKTEDPASDPALITSSVEGASPQRQRIDF